MTSLPEPTVGFAIVNYHSAHLVADLVASLAKATPKGDCHVCVVDNSDERAELETLLWGFRCSLRITILSPETNLGYAAGNNAALEELFATGSQLVWVLNPDVTILRMRASELAAEWCAGDMDIAGTGLHTEEGTVEGLGQLSLSLRTSLPRDAGRGRIGPRFPLGHSVVWGKKAFEVLGGFCEDYFLYYEEADLALRARQKGLRVGSLRGAVVAHTQGGSTLSGKAWAERSAVGLFHSSRSCVIYARRNLRPWGPAWALSMRFAFGVALLARGSGGAFVASLRGAWAGLRAELSA